MPAGNPSSAGGGALHRLVDRLAMAFEDRAPRAAVPWRPGPDLPLDPSGPLPGLPPLRRTLARGPRSGVAILVPPWKIRSTALLSPWVRSLGEAGFDTWIPVPPFHLERTPPGERGGEGMIGPDLQRTREALETAIREVRACLAAAGREGVPVVLVGLSLGGLVGAWSATGPERVDALALVAPPADLPAVFRETPIGRRYASLAFRAGAPVPGGEELEQRLSWLAPLGRTPVTRRVLIVAGMHDAVAPGGAAALGRAWGSPVRAFPRGHLTLLFGCPAARREVAAFVSGGGPAGPATSSRPAARP